MRTTQSAPPRISADPVSRLYDAYPATARWSIGFSAAPEGIRVSVVNLARHGSLRTAVGPNVSGACAAFLAKYEHPN